MFYSITNCHDGLRGVPFGSFLIKQVEDLRVECPRIRRFATLSPVPLFGAWLAQERLHCEIPPAPDCEDLIALCARYLLFARKGHEPLDPVARFHLRNGARLERINCSRGQLMVNYVYRVAEIEENHERYAREGAVVSARAIKAAARRNCGLT